MKKLLNFMMRHTFFLSPAMWICYAIITALSVYAINEAREQFAEEERAKNEVAKIRPGQDGHGIYRGPFNERDNETETKGGAIPIPFIICYNENA